MVLSDHVVASKTPNTVLSQISNLSLSNCKTTLDTSSNIEEQTEDKSDEEKEDNDNDNSQQNEEKQTENVIVI